MKLRITVNGRAYDVQVEVLDDDAPAALDADAVAAHPAPAASLQPPASPERRIDSPIFGNVLSVLVKPGDSVETNQTLVVIEAIKMETKVISPGPGTVTAVHAAPGDRVDVGDPLVSF